MASTVTPDDVRLNYNPEQPQVRFKEAGLRAANLKQKSQRLPSPVPWPENKPTPAPPMVAPSENAGLGAFKGYDAVVMTYTSAEAAALATLFTPGFEMSSWYEDRHNIDAYIPLVTGPNAPFNSRDAEDVRYYHSLGLYFPITIGKAKVLLIKSGLHLDYDGPAVPIQKRVAELLQTIEPKVFITTGTGGGIGSDVALGDVVIAGLTRFDCTKQFQNSATFPWNKSVSQTTRVPAAALSLITPDLTAINADRIRKYNSRAIPKIWSDPTDTIVTTDSFAFDDSRDTEKLQGLGQACDMGDAMIGHVMKGFPKISWFAIRNASDPQIPNPNNDFAEATRLSTAIYSDYGVFTTAASVISTWAIINALFN